MVGVVSEDSQRKDILLNPLIFSWLSRSSLKCFFNSHNPPTGCVCEIIPTLSWLISCEGHDRSSCRKMLSTVIPVNASYICALIRMAGCQRTFSGSINILAYYLRIIPLNESELYTWIIWFISMVLYITGTIHMFSLKHLYCSFIFLYGIYSIFILTDAYFGWLMY